MRTIQKFDLGNKMTSEHDLPIGVEFRYTGLDAEGKLCIWMQLDDEATDMNGTRLVCSILVNRFLMIGRIGDRSRSARMYCTFTTTIKSSRSLSMNSDSMNRGRVNERS